MDADSGQVRRGGAEGPQKLRRLHFGHRMPLDGPDELHTGVVADKRKALLIVGADHPPDVRGRGTEALEVRAGQQLMHRNASIRPKVELSVGGLVAEDCR